ncbi:MAG TPA: dephospho-CoA kinase [Epulopiscium sp.]|nr:dephospho-CoA kinase [Candidatus Epulonipiscium sp.]
MQIIGIVGGMGSGKSTVVGLLSELANTYIINADDIGHEILKKGSPGYIPAIEAFGDQILGTDGEINRRVLGEIVFSDPKALQKLNNISHPLIYKAVKEQIETALEKGSNDYIIVDAALLIEIGLIELVDQVWGVYVPVETQIQRVMVRNGLSKEEAIKRISTQLPWSKIKKRITIQINNTSTTEHTKEQIRYLLEQNLKGL